MSVQEYLNGVEDRLAREGAELNDTSNLTFGKYMLLALISFVLYKILFRNKGTDE